MDSNSKKVLRQMPSASVRNLKSFTQSQNPVNGNLQQINQSLFYDRMLVRLQLQHVKAWDGSYGKLHCFQQNKTKLSMVHRVRSKGTALRAVGRKSHVGSNPTHAIFVNIQHIYHNIKTQNLPAVRRRRFESCLGCMP